MALTQKEIIEFEENNSDVIRLYLEGTFLKAYERSAFAFCTRVKYFKVLRKESKTLGRDILYVGFPAAAVEPTLSGCMTRHIDENTIDVVLSYPIDENEFLVWRDAKEVEMASRALISPYTRVIEKTPVYKIGYDILSQIILVSKNISKNCQNPFGIRMKEISYKCCFIIRSLYDVKGQARVKAIDDALPLYEELSFLLQLMKDCKEISNPEDSSLVSEGMSGFFRDIPRHQAAVLPCCRQR